MKHYLAFPWGTLTPMLILRLSVQRPRSGQGHLGKNFNQRTCTVNFYSLNRFQWNIPRWEPNPCAHFHLIRSKVRVTLEKKLAKTFNKKLWHLLYISITCIDFSETLQKIPEGFSTSLLILGHQVKGQGHLGNNEPKTWNIDHNLLQPHRFQRNIYIRSEG